MESIAESTSTKLLPRKGGRTGARGRLRMGFVLAACTETYLRRYDNQEETGTGRGVKWEAFVITQELYECDWEAIRPHGPCCRSCAPPWCGAGSFSWPGRSR